MRTLKAITLGLIMVVAFGTAKANAPKANNDNTTVSQVVKTYIDAMMHGQIAELDAIIDAGAKFSVLTGKQVASYTKEQILEFAKANENVDQNCTVSSTIRESNNDITVVKVDMKYPTFTRTNYVTLANTGKGWKITNVYSVFK